MDRQSLISQIFYNILLVGIMAGISWYAQEHSITAGEFVKVFASIPLPVVLFIMIMDYLFDTGSLYRKVSGRNKGLVGIVTALGVAGFFFITVTWLIAGTITLNFSAITPVTYVVAGSLTLLLLWPKTGTTQFVLLYYLSVQLITKFAYFTLLGGVGLG
ncbi:hypothetical protein P8X24_11635 [Pyrococcus kukulkanii]|uniref:hypothetical protein n=1 Tax=Pyrococcus kukulkanii TaxID=1609559 RepID=UPI003569FB5F